MSPSSTACQRCGLEHLTQPLSHLGESEVSTVSSLRAEAMPGSSPVPGTTCGCGTGGHWWARPFHLPLPRIAVVILELRVSGSPVPRFVSTERRGMFSLWATFDRTHLPRPAASISLNCTHRLTWSPKSCYQVQAPLLPLTTIFQPTWHRPWSSEAAVQTRGCAARKPCLDRLCPLWAQPWSW